MGLIATAVAVSVTIAGTPMPLAVVSEAVESLAPEVDSCTLVVEWGDRRISGSADPAETLPALGAEVIVTTAGGYEWRGHLMSRRRVASGSRRRLMLQAMGPGIHADRAYLPTFARYGNGSSVVQAAGGPRFAPGTRSASSAGPGGTFLLGGTNNWTVGEALAAMLAHATYAGLPTITLDATGATLTRKLPDTDCDGLSFHASLQAIMSHRMGLVWRLQLTSSGWVMRVRPTTGSGATVDLSTGDVMAYDIGEDATAAVASLEVRGARRRYVVSIDAYTSGSGDLNPDWSAGDVTARTADPPDFGSPAYRRFKIDHFTLPDGTSSTAAAIVSGLPIAAESPLASGSSSWLVFAQKTSGSAWISLQGRVSISVYGGRVWIEGIDPAEWATWTRIRLTLCLSPRTNVNSVTTGGSGTGRGLVIVGHRHTYADNATVRVTDTGTLIDVSGDALSAESSTVTDAAGDLWSSLGSTQWAIEWTRDGISTANAVGSLVTSLTVPAPGGSSSVSCLCIVSSRRITWSGGKPSTTWRAVPRPFTTGAISR
jgi:hypothetical protein